MMSCQSLTTASASPAKALRRLMPALLTRIEGRPRRLATSAAIARQAVAVGDVEREGVRLAAGFGDVRGRLAAAVAIDVEHGDRRALAGKAERDGAADSRGGAGDGRDVILQKSGHLCCPPCRMKRSENSSARPTKACRAAQFNRDAARP